MCFSTHISWVTLCMLYTPPPQFKMYASKSFLQKSTSSYTIKFFSAETNLMSNISAGKWYNSVMRPRFAKYNIELNKRSRLVSRVHQIVLWSGWLENIYCNLLPLLRRCCINTYLTIHEARAYEPRPFVAYSASNTRRSANKNYPHCHKWMLVVTCTLPTITNHGNNFGTLQLVMSLIAGS